MGDNALRVNGSDIGAHGRGINALEIDTVGNKIKTSNYDVYGSPTSATDNLISFIETASGGNILMFAANDHAGNITDAGVSKFESLGSTKIQNVQDGGRNNWAFICLKGVGRLSEKFEPSAEGPVTTDYTFPENLDITPGGTVESNLSEVGPAAGSLVGWWPLDGNTRDYSGSNNGTNNGASVTSGLGQSAYDFDGDSDYIQTSLSGDIANSAYSASIWFKLDSFNTDEIFVGNYSGGSGILLRVEEGDEYDFWQDSGSIEGGTVTLNEWTHVVYVYDGSNAKIYENTEQVASGSVPDNTNSSDLRIGDTYDNRKFDGTMQDVRIYDRVLSVDEIKTLYNLTDPRTDQRVTQSSDGDVYTKTQFDETL